MPGPKYCRPRRRAPPGPMVLMTTTLQGAAVHLAEGGVEVGSTPSVDWCFNKEEHAEDAGLHHNPISESALNYCKHTRLPSLCTSTVIWFPNFLT